MTSHQERLEAAQAANPEFASLTGEERITAIGTTIHWLPATNMNATTPCGEDRRTVTMATGAQQATCPVCIEAQISTIEPLHPAILAAYRGVIIEIQRNGATVIRFDSARHATGWAQTCEIENRTFFSYANGRGLALPCDIVYIPQVT